MDRFKLLVEMIAAGEEVIFTTREEVFRVILQPIPKGTHASTQNTSLNIDVESITKPGSVVN